MGRLVSLWELLRDAGLRWSDDNCMRLGAALAYYAVFSIFPLVLLAVTVVGFVMGEGPETRTRILDALSTTTTPAFKGLFDDTLRGMQTHTAARGVGTVVGLVTLVFGASGVFSELQATLNHIWSVPPRAYVSFWGSVGHVARRKALSFVVVLGAAVAILGSLVVTALALAIGHTVEGATSGFLQPGTLWMLTEATTSVTVITLILAVVFRLIPDAPVAWSDVFGGAFLTALLFTVIKHLLAYYLGHVGAYAAYGAVGVFLGLLTWIYLASLFLFYGAEFCRVYAERHGSLSRKG